MANNLPGQGAIRLARFREEKPYVHQAYPSMRFHPDGREARVESAAHDAEACPPEDGWKDSPFPPKPKAAPVAEVTVADLRAKLVAQATQFDKSWSEVIQANEELKRVNAALRDEFVVKVEAASDATPVEDAIEPISKAKKTKNA